MFVTTIGRATAAMTPIITRVIKDSAKVKALFKFKVKGLLVSLIELNNLNILNNLLKLFKITPLLLK